ncbi:hypothetical protein KIN20_007115 [Parelaphostrongylus tenuis]|uniref:Skp1-related protein n=1 Tax=Parelaphostrongylus tenuis TaxID=148309 RepID=A0AAD5MLP3_PARTN|nr:hypothetical protein KIN20_007115 [Parelaphostrongylus tenuis]
MSGMESASNSVNSSAERSSIQRMCKLKTNDSQIFEVPAAVASMSKVIGTLIENLDLRDDDEPIPLPNVDSQVLRKVLLWCEIHLHDERGAESQKHLKEWDDQFFNVDDAMLFKITRAANYLDIAGLLDEGITRIAEKAKV